MRFDPRTALVVFACGAAAACATSSGSKNLGDIKVTAAQPANAVDTSTADFTFIVNEGRLLLTSPGDVNAFDLTEEANGCLRGTVVLGRYGTPIPASAQDDDVEIRQICPVGPATGGVTQWRDEISKLTFTAQVSADGSRIIVDSGATHGEFQLGQGPAANELRRRPELLAAAFAYGYVPQTAIRVKDGSTGDYTFIVASQ